MWWVSLVQPAHAGAWVLDAERPRAVERAIKAARRAEITDVVPYDRRRVCVEVADPSLRVRNRVARRLRGPVETRDSCDWGWFPEGTGWVAVVLDPPVAELLPVLDELAWPYYDLQVPSGGPIRLCASQVVAGDRAALEATLTEAGLSVRGVRLVGACRREP